MVWRKLKEIGLRGNSGSYLFLRKKCISCNERKWCWMILFIILALIVLLLIGFLVLAISVGGALSILLFGDVIVCIFIIVWIMKKIISGWISRMDCGNTVFRFYHTWKLQLLEKIRRCATYEKEQGIRKYCP